jgi:hypothetical protein
VQATITVGYESQVNHGLAYAKTTGQGADTQPAYTPIVLRRDQYSPAIYNAGNVIVTPAALFVVVGLWDNFTPAPTVTT